MRIIFFVSIGVVFTLIGCHKPPLRLSTPPPQNDLICLGVEPFWSLKIYTDSLIWQTPETAAIVFNRQKASTKDNATKIIVGSHPKHDSLSVEIIEQVCQDSMSGESFAFTVRINWQGSIFYGCGRHVTSVQPKL